MSVPPTELLEGTDPTHPLYGLTLPCLGITTKPRLGRACIVWLAPGIERLRPLAATSLAPVPPPPARCHLSLPAVRALLAVLASLPTDAAPRQEDADGPTAPTAAPGGGAPGPPAGATAAESPPAAPPAAGPGPALAQSVPAPARPTPAGPDPPPPGGGR